MTEEDEEAGDMSLSNLKVPRIARNVMKMWISRKKLLKFAFQCYFGQLFYNALYNNNDNNINTPGRELCHQTSALVIS